MRITTVVSGIAAVALAVTVGPDAHATPADHHDDLTGRIAFTAPVADGPPQLFTIRPDGTGLRQLTHFTDAEADDADWSPDGRKIAFTVGQVDEPVARIAMINADGTDLRFLPIPGPVVVQPSFTPDGKRIFFERNDLADHDSIVSSNLDGTDERAVTHPPAGVYVDSEPNVGPDGKTLSFVRATFAQSTEPAALFTLDLSTGRERQLTPFSANVAIKTDWSPNGDRIVFSKGGFDLQPGVSSNVVTIDRRGRHERNVTNYAGGQVNAIAGSYSPDGRWIVFRRETNGGATGTLTIIRPDGRDLTVIPNAPNRPRFIAWGPAAR